MILRLYIELDGLYPPIWRRVEVHHELSLAGLHKVIQACFGWSNSALYTFRDELEDYSLRHQDDMWQLDPSHTDVRDIRLKQVLGPGRQVLHYRYGLGLTGWEHLIRVEERSASAPDDEPTIRCTGGQRACPPEAAAGPLGYREILRQWEARQLDPMIASWLPTGFDPERFEPAQVQLPSMAQLQAQASLDAGLDAAIFGLDGLQLISPSPAPSPSPQQAPAPQRRPYAWLKEQAVSLIQHAQRGQHEAFVDLLMVELLRSELDMVGRRRLIDELKALDALKPSPPTAAPPTPSTPAPTYAQRHQPRQAVTPSSPAAQPAPSPQPAATTPPEAAPAPVISPPPDDDLALPQAASPAASAAPLGLEPIPSPARSPDEAAHEVRQASTALAEEAAPSDEVVRAKPEAHQQAASSAAPQAPAVSVDEADELAPYDAHEEAPAPEVTRSTPIDEALPAWEDAPALAPLDDSLYDGGDDSIEAPNDEASLKPLDALPALESGALEGLEPLEPLSSLKLDELEHHPATLEPLPELEAWSASPDEHDQLDQLPSSHDVLADLDDGLPIIAPRPLEPLAELSALSGMPALEDGPSWELPPHDDPFAQMEALPELDAWRAPSLLAATFERFEQALELKPLPAQPTLSACLDRLPVEKLDLIWSSLALKDPPGRRREREAHIISLLLRADALMDLVDEHLDAEQEALLKLLLEAHGRLSDEALLLHRERLGPSLHAEWFMDDVRSPLSALRALGLVFAGLDEQGRQCALIPQELRQLLGVVLG